MRACGQKGHVLAWRRSSVSRVFARHAEALSLIPSTTHTGQSSTHTRNLSQQEGEQEDQD